MSTPLNYKVYTSPMLGFAVSSTIIYGETEAIVIDSQMLPMEAEKVVKIIQETGKELTKILITHAHLDHFGATEVFTKAYPHVEVLAEEGVVELIQKTGQKQIKGIELLYQNNSITPKEVIVPSIFPAQHIHFDNNISIEVITDLQGDFAPHSAFYLPDLKMLVVGDLAYPGVHLWTADTNNEQREHWIASLEKLKTYDCELMITGHKDEKCADSPQYIDENIAYLKDFNEANTQSNTAQELIEIMKAKYPNLIQSNFLKIGAYKNKKESFDMAALMTSK